MINFWAGLCFQSDNFVIALPLSLSQAQTHTHFSHLSCASRTTEQSSAAMTYFLCLTPEKTKHYNVEFAVTNNLRPRQQRLHYLLLALGAVPGTSRWSFEGRVQAIGVEGSGAIVARLKLSVFFTDSAVVVMLHFLLTRKSNIDENSLNQGQRLGGLNIHKNQI